MALLSIQGDWRIFFWLIYCKIYSAIIWLFGNHCRGADKARSVITTGVGGQSPGGLQRVRTRRRRASQQHRVKHIVALARRPSIRRIVMAPGSNTAHAMMEDKEKALHGALATASLRSRRISQFAPLLIALVGLPARGKSQLAHRLSRHLNWNGESTKVFDCSEYRRKHMALYGSHDIFRADNQQGSAIRRQSAREAVQDAVLWLKDGNSVAIFDGTNITREQRRELSDYCLSDMGFRILFIECVCEDQELLERNIIEILHYSADYKSMSEEEAVDDLRKKLEHYMRQYEPIDADLETISFVRVENIGETVTAHRVAGQKESGILGYLSGMRALPQTLYFTRMPPRKHKPNIIKKRQKRTHFQYTEEALKQAIRAIRTENKSIRGACRHYCVPRSTVQDRISGRIKEQPRKVGPEPILGIDGEQKVVDWIIELAKCGIPISKEDLLKTVTNLIKDIGKENKFPEGRPGQTWYQNFLKRHPEISVREPEGINKAREGVRESLIRKWFTDLESFLIERGIIDFMKDPDRILNADETGVSLCPKSGKVLAPKGYKNVYIVKRGNEKETITVLMMITASGKVCPPLVVFPYIRPPRAVVENMPEGWTIGKTESGWMRSDVFYEYIANDFNNWLVENNVKKPIILFVDGHKSHMSMPLSQFCEENNIILYALPPNTTHIMQPADVSVFRPLKQEWKRTVRNWQAKPENLNKTVTKTNFCKVFKETLDTDMTQAVKNGFRKCGLFPFDVNAVDFTKCVKDFQERRKKRSLSSSKLTLQVQQRCLF